MQSKKLSIRSTAMLAVLGVCVHALDTRAVAQREIVLHNFNNNGSDGWSPISSLIFDKVGNLYGTTLGGGLYNGGTVFELQRTANGGWTEKVLYSFNPKTGDGYEPDGGLVFDTAGNLYGTTYVSFDAGTVFELLPQADGSWSKKTLHRFSNKGGEGGFPNSTLVLDALGNLYGTTAYGGQGPGCNRPAGCETVFELIPRAGGIWDERVLFSFPNQGTGTGGASAEGSLNMDALGNLYGATVYGGTYGLGRVFRLAPTTTGYWTETDIFSFDQPSVGGRHPGTNVIFDSAGNIYGTTYWGGPYLFGTVFELTPTPGGGWTETVLHSFGTKGTGGVYPNAGLIFDAAGNLYDTASEGTADGGGAAFELSPGAGGSWTEEVLAGFTGTNGAFPVAGMIFDSAGNLYGTTLDGGIYGGGVVFEITP